MVGSRKPGPLGMGGVGEAIEDGTLIRQASPRPGSLGVHGGGRHRSRRKPRVLPLLRVGSHGPEVIRLQRLLNARVVPSPKLAIDGVFGPRTLAAVRVFQKGRTIKRDGIVGRVTWAHLLGGQTVRIPRRQQYKGLEVLSLVPIPTSPASPEPGVVTIRETVWEWPLRKKILAVIDRVPSRLPERARREWNALISPEGLATTLTLIILFSLLSGGTALILGAIVLGFDALMSLAACLQITAYAASEPELDDAADELAHIVIAATVAVFLASVTKAAGKLASSGKAKALSPAEPSPPNAMEPPPGLKPTELPPPKPSTPPPRWTPCVEIPQSPARAALVSKVREVTGNPDIVFWEEVGYGNVWKEISATPEQAARLNVRPGDVIGYIQEGAPMGAAFGDIMFLETLALDPPFPDPFLL